MKAWVWGGLLLWAWSAASAAPFEVQRSRESPEHARLVLAPRPGTERATLHVVFTVGRYDEGGLVGLTRAAQHVMLEANRRGRYEDLVRELFGANATLTMSTGLRQSGFTLIAPRQDFDALAEHLLPRLLSPQVDAARLDDALERTGQDPSLTFADDFLESVLAVVLSTEPRFRAPVPPSAQSVLSFSDRDIAAYLSGPLSPRNAVVIAAGDFDVEALKRTVARYKGGTPSAVTRLSPQLPVTLKLPAVSDINVLAYPIELGDARQAAAARVVGALLGQRLEQRFRRLGVGYAQDASVVLTPWMDQLVLTLPARDPSALDLGPFMLEEVGAVREGRVSAEEFAQARAQVLARLRTDDRSPTEVGLALAASVHSPAWYAPELEAALTSLTLESLTQSVRGWLGEDRRIHLLFTPSVVPLRSTAGVRMRRR
ncbi:MULTISPECIES: M16 family metallopeptidase [unclassified Corallococcus]|uniref:M16 family metallopeptidase n=1 Tax=unclassified Corallococcus TaxID=2685029 RepID=UPI001A8CAD1A|nr:MULTISPECIES: insulinase family protein [unclassified Corallococcus]MBN9682731.1 insulinase family protein [Corallococcus sp. NCSPR001]WAS85728.1 insulinase family protein [Corallococcus sp. NCRR]